MESVRPKSIAPIANAAIAIGIVRTIGSGPRIDGWQIICSIPTTATRPKTPRIRSNQRARLASSHHSTTSKPIRNGPKALAIQIIEGPLGIRPGTNRINPISGTSTIGIQILKGRHVAVLVGCAWS